VQRELDLLGPEEVLAGVSGLALTDELTGLISRAYRIRALPVNV
jgi:hypothetical protein